MAPRVASVVSCLSLALLSATAEPVPSHKTSSAYYTSSSWTTSYYQSSYTTISTRTTEPHASSSYYSQSSIATETSQSNSYCSHNSSGTSSIRPTATSRSESYYPTYTSSRTYSSSQTYTSSQTSTPPTETGGYGSGAKFHPEGSSAGFYCEYPDFSDWEACNGADSRDCWLRKSDAARRRRGSSNGSDDQWGGLIDIHTDYEDVDMVPTGVVREYWIEHDGDIILTADGFEKTTGKVFNRTFPAPIIEACWGDKLKIHVKNNYKSNGTTIHWHGIRQLGTNQADGVNGVTQCPIAQGDSYTYEWQATQYGSTWYHSHYALQYSDGAVGPLVIYGPSSSNWDVNVGPVLVQDYVHETAFIEYQLEKTTTNFARADSIVVNGKGHDPATGTGSYSDVKLTPGKKNLIRLINSSAGTTFVFSIDGHSMTVVANDLVAIEPYETTSLRIAIGQRYTVIVEANQTPDNYWIRTHPATGCNGFSESLGTCPGTSGPAGVFTDTCVLFDVRTAIASYEGVDAAELPTSSPVAYDLACQDEPYAQLRPVVPWVIDERPANNITRDRFTVVHQNPGLPAEDYQPGGYQHWEFTNDFFWINFEEPTILNTSYQGEWDPHSHVIKEPYTSGFIFMIFEANTNSPVENGTAVIPIAHPIHWHGHDVVILAQSTTQFDPATSFSTFNFDNPPRRDVALLPANGFLAIAMRADNPGAWLIHCHIAWHSSAGLAMQNLESQSSIVGSLGGDAALDETRRVCDNWRAFNDRFPIEQDESGV